MTSPHDPTGSPSPSSSLLDAWAASNWDANQFANPNITTVAIVHNNSTLLDPIKHLATHLPNLIYIAISDHDNLHESINSVRGSRTHWFVSFVQDLDSLRPGQVHISCDGAPFLFCVKYHRLIEAFRGLGHILASKCTTNAETPEFPFHDYTETAQFNRSGLMMDCSRGCVPLLKTLYLFIRYLSILGINTLLLYTEDTYEVEGEPFFGHLRGRFTHAELKAIDDYAFMFGIEVIPCIQTLGHLGQILQWPAYAHLRDTHEVMLVHSNDTLKFIEKLIVAATQPFRSVKIHLGMDECAGLGDGRYKHYFSSSDDPINRSKLFLDHLNAVVQISRNLGKEPLIWSDMLFCLAKEDVSLQGYYESPNAISTTSTPVEAVFWSYYSTSPTHYTERIQVHRRDLHQNPWVASGIWTWNRLWTALPFTFQATQACLTAARTMFSSNNNAEITMNNVFTTIWGDDGAECDLFSTFPALIYFAHGCYAQPTDPTNVDPSHNLLTSWFAGVFGGKLEDWLHASRLDNPSLSLAPQSTHTQFPPNLSKWLLWEDPLYAHLSGQAPAPDILTKTYSDIHDTLLLATSSQVVSKYPFNQHLKFPCAHAKVLRHKAGLRERMRLAYLEGNAGKLKELCDTELSLSIEAAREMWMLHREIWMSRNQPFGWEILDLRYGGLRARLDTLQFRITNFVSTHHDMSQIQQGTSRLHISASDQDNREQDMDDGDDQVVAGHIQHTTCELPELVPASLVIWEGAGDQVLVDFARAFTPMRALGTG